MNNTEQVSKIDAAIRQLETAALLYFSDGDICSIHTLAAASLEITSTLAKGTDIENFLIQDKIYSKIPENKRNHAHKIIQYQRNFLKHADRDKEKILDFSPDITDIILLSAVIPLRVLACKNNIKNFRFDNNKIRPSAVEILLLWFCFKEFYKDNGIVKLNILLKETKLNIQLPETPIRKNFHLLCYSMLDKFVEQYGEIIGEIFEKIVESDDVANLMDNFKFTMKVS